MEDMWLQEKTEAYTARAYNKFIPIPQIKVTDEGKEEYRFIDFDIDLNDLIMSQ